MRQIFIIFFLFFSFSVYAAREAVVRKDRAIVYADKSKTGALGFLRVGRKLRVGSREHGPYRMLAILVSGKVAYIQASDVTYTQSNVLAKAIERPGKRGNANPQLISISSFRLMSASMARTDSEGDGLYGKGFSMVGLELSSAILFKKRWLWGLDGNVMMLKSKVSEKRFVSLSTGIGLNLIRLPNFWLNGYFMVGGVPYIYASGPTNSANATGLFMGPKGEVIFEFAKDLKVSAVAEIYRYSFSNMTTASQEDSSSAENATGYAAKFTSLNVGVGLTWIIDFL